MKTTSLIFLILLAIAPLSPASDLPDSSVYQYDSTWVDQNNRQTPLVELRGEARLVAFVYTYCEHTCPLIIAQIKDVLRSLPDNLGEVLPVTLITLDPSRDTPDQMKSYMVKNGLDEQQWTMLTGDSADVRVLSNLFDVKYRAMNKDDLVHSNIITLLDDQGEITFQMRGLNSGEKELVEQISALALISS